MCQEWWPRCIIIIVIAINLTGSIGGNADLITAGVAAACGVVISQVSVDGLLSCEFWAADAEIVDKFTVFCLQ